MFDLNELREILKSELKGINNYYLADRVDLLKDEEVKDILLKCFVESYKKGDKVC